MPIVAPQRKKAEAGPNLGLRIVSESVSGHSLFDPGFVSPELVRAVTGIRREQDARICRILGLMAIARRDRRRDVTISLRDLQCLIAEAKIPHDLERMRA